MSNTEQQQPTTAPAPQVAYVEAPKKSHKIRNLTVGLIGSIAVIAAISTAAGGEAEVVKEVDASVKASRIVDDAWAMVPMDWENASGAQTETRPGGTVTYQSAFDAGNPTMVSVVGYDADYNETWADFPLT